MFTIRMQMSFSAITFVANVGRLVVANVRRLAVANMGRLVLANVRRLVVANMGRLVLANVRRLAVANMGRLVLANVRRLVLGKHTAIGCSECAAISSGFDIFAGITL